MMLARVLQEAKEKGLISTPIEEDLYKIAYLKGLDTVLKELNQFNGSFNVNQRAAISAIIQHLAN